MKHLILGTAGHIDHGKTSLVKALTGIDCDTHKEEKLRGITINLGFASLLLPSGNRIGIVDVPGHRDFVHTMVAGASGIDIALMVIAADSGIMPQTREHLRIMQILGIRTGLIALTRIDLTTPEIITMAEDEIRELTKGTFLEDSPIVKVSSRTGEGIDELKQQIDRIAIDTPDRNNSGVFRMYIDRIFSVSGFGTVVTGSVTGGTIKAGDTAWLLPSGKNLRIRKIQRHGQDVSEVTAGDRASLNLSGLSKEEFSRGMLITDRRLNSTNLIDVRLRLFDHNRTLSLWSSGIFLLGTFEAQVRVHLLDTDYLRSGKEAFAQIHLPQACIAGIGDRFVLRSTSSDITLGGGEIIDASPLHHRRRPEKLIDKLKLLAQGKLPELAASEIRKHRAGTGLTALANALNCDEASLKEICGSFPEDIMILSSEGNLFFISEQDYKNIKSNILNNIDNFHKKNALLTEGRTAEELLGSLGIDHGTDSHQILLVILDHLEKEGVLKRVRHTWSLSGHKAGTSNNFDMKKIGIVEGYLKKCAMKAPLITELETEASLSGIDNKELKQILRYLSANKNIYPVEGTYLHSTIVDSVRVKLLVTLDKTPDGLTVAQFRDLIDANRKICLLLYSIYDNEGYTERKGDVRVITEKGKSFIPNQS
jgi:selenocysteine-specific elongation factor